MYLKVRLLESWMAMRPGTITTVSTGEAQLLLARGVAEEFEETPKQPQVMDKAMRGPKLQHGRRR